MSLDLPEMVNPQNSGTIQQGRPLPGNLPDPATFQNDPSPSTSRREEGNDSQPGGPSKERKGDTQKARHSPESIPQDSKKTKKISHEEVISQILVAFEQLNPIVTPVSDYQRPVKVIFSDKSGSEYQFG